MTLVPTTWFHKTLTLLNLREEMPTTTRSIIVGNTDSSIKYFPSQSWDLVGNGTRIPTPPNPYPKPHEIDNGWTLQFDFNGTQIALFGTTGSIQSWDIDSAWTCSIDHEDILSNTSESAFCYMEGLADGPHVLTLNGTRGGQPFSVDYISYTPSEGVLLDNSLIRVSNVDPNIHFSPGWEPIDEYNITRTAGSWMSFGFIGQSLSWYGDMNYTNTPPTASYTVDGNPPLPIPTVPTHGPVPSQNRLLFETPNLSPGPHTIRVTLDDSQSSTPLMLAFILVQNGTDLDAVSSPTSTLTPTSTSTPSSSIITPNSHTKVNIGAIVGGSLAAIILLLLLAFLFIRYRKQTRKTRIVTIRPFISNFSKSVTDKAVPQPVHHDIKPQQSYRPLNAYDDEINEKSPYYGGYQTWGQIKAMEAVSKSKIRDSYM